MRPRPWGRGGTLVPSLPATPYSVSSLRVCGSPRRRKQDVGQAGRAPGHNPCEVSFFSSAFPLPELPMESPPHPVLTPPSRNLAQCPLDYTPSFSPFRVCLLFPLPSLFFPLDSGKPSTVSLKHVTPLPSPLQFRLAEVPLSLAPLPQPLLSTEKLGKACSGGAGGECRGRALRGRAGGRAAGILRRAGGAPCGSRV